MSQTYTFHVTGLHCSACVLLTQSELMEFPGITAAKTNLQHNTIQVTGEFENMSAADIVQKLNRVLQPHGYTLSAEMPEKKNTARNWSEFGIALPIAIGFIVFFLILQKLGIVNLITTSEVSYSTAFLIGLIASVSTCMAIVGGLVLSLSASFAKGGDTVRPQVLFHIGRLVAFFLLGGVIGSLGASFQLSWESMFALNIVVGLVMLILGINLLDLFPWMKKLQLTLPGSIGKKAHDLKNINHTLTPLLVGVGTFFLPCGFTQSMQLYALTTGNFFTGGLLMLVFALGTLPVLGLLSFSSLAVPNRFRSGIFFKTAGLVVVFFALFNLLNAFVAAGWIPPLFNL